MGVHRWALVLCLVLVGCIRSSSVVCDNGMTCPAGDVCDELHGACVLPEQLMSCLGSIEGSDCAIEGRSIGVCKDEVCLVAGCGDGIVNGLEQCDPAVPGGLGELGDCTAPQHGYYDPGTVTCTDQCRFDVSACTSYCGDGELNGGETCDGDQLAGITCMDYGFPTPEGLACSSLCVYDLSGCVAPAPVIAVGSGGSIFRWLGTSWLPMMSGTSQSFNAVWGSGGKNVYAVGSGGSVRRWDGIRWSQVDASTGSSLYAIAGSGPDHVVAVGNNGTVVRWDGATWTPSTIPNVSTTLRGVWTSGPDNIIVVGGDSSGTIRRWDGASWQVFANPAERLNAVWGSDANNVFAVGDNGLILRWTGGSTWSAMTSQTPEHLYGIWGSGATRVVAAGNAGTIRNFAGTGSTWTSTTLPANAMPNLKAVWGHATGVFAVGSSGASVRYESGGWTSDAMVTSHTLQGIWAGDN